MLAGGIGFVGFVMFLSGFAVFASGSAGLPLGGPTYGAIVATAGALMMPAAVGVWRLDTWGWWLAVGCAAALALAVLTLGPNKVGVVLGLAVLGFLVLFKDDFRIGKGRQQPAGRKRASRGRKRAGHAREARESHHKTKK